MDSSDSLPCDAPAVPAPAAAPPVPVPAHYTREQWLGYRVVSRLSDSGLDIQNSPAVAVWAVVTCEIIAWMDEHGIPRGMRPAERDTPTVS